MNKLRLAAGLLLAAWLTGCASPPPADRPAVSGIVWQVDNATVDPRGSWQLLGASELLIQWTVVDDTSFVAGSGLPAAPVLPDWKRIASEPWAREVIVGLAGRFDEARARADVAELGRASARLARIPMPLNISGWYFPVEIDPTWADGGKLKAVLDSLPRPLWVSAYDSANLGPEELAAKLAQWLPSDVGVFFQDGVGVHARDAHTARHYADVLAKRLGKQRVRIIVEAFRPGPGSGFRAATAEEIAGQLRHYTGYKTYLFDGPHYVPDSTVQELLR
ncbi:hypothetical protein [Massilia sp. BSC265]|uniref:hypothetical protein n=1 Tax=Massilia sp. BSC265 TaxID=1549812 RepID=UPI0004E8E011|nr:hypothetical protein [Massilia sp. BSC265]KFI08500.1 hypothetical protein JN27_03845 [Massilia sp. BSC265]